MDTGNARDSRRRAPRPSARRTRGGSQGSPARVGKGVWLAAGLVGLMVATLGVLRLGEDADISESAAVQGESSPAEAARETDARPNHPPTIQSARIVPQAPNARSRIGVVIESADPEGDQIRYDVRWYRNGRRLDVPPLQSLPKGTVHRGERIRAEVVATDGTDSSRPFRSREVLIQNLPPVATHVEISPANLVVGQALEAKPVADDPDGDTVLWRYRWVRNDEGIGGQNRSTLPGEFVRKGDRIRVIATPRDHAGPGTAIESAEAVPGNQMPRIVSNPPAKLDGGKISYQVEARDADGDPVKFSLEGDVPSGLRISELGALEGDLRDIAPGRYDIQIVAADPSGERDTQLLTLKVPEKPAPSSATQ